MSDTPVKTKPAMIYVGNLNYSITDKSLQAMFGAFGTVETVNMMRDTSTNKKTGVAFLQMSDEKDALKAIAHFNGKEVGGRTLKVSIAQDRYEGKAKRSERKPDDRSKKRAPSKSRR